MKNCLLHFTFLGWLTVGANLVFAGSDIQIAVKNPFPVCITELHQIEPDIPLSFFHGDERDPKASAVLGHPDSCVRELNIELEESGIREGISYFINTFPQVDRTLFADDFMRKKDHDARLKRLNQTLIQMPGPH